MNTTDCIQEFHNKELREYNSHLSTKDKLKNWCFKHSTTLKIIQIAALVFGVAALIPFPLSIAAFGVLTLATGLTAMLGLTGALIAAVNSVALKFFDLVIAPHHNMASHSFKPASYGVGKLYYQGDVPILELQSDDPYQAGVAHGFIMGPQLNQLISRLKFAFRLDSRPLAKDIPNVIHAIRETIPKDYLKELQGIAEGYSKWRQSKLFKEKITLEDLILFHLLSEELHFFPAYLEAKLNPSNPFPLPPINHPESVVGCTVVIDKDEKEGLVFGRNMDWPSLGLFGKLSLIINRKYSGEKNSTIEIGLPGCVGTLTGMNAKGLSLSMNVCDDRTEEIQGMPAMFFNRMCLDSCTTIDEVENKIHDFPPLGAYHLSAADSQGKAKVFHLFQGLLRTHVTRNLKDDQPLIAANCSFIRDDISAIDGHCSKERMDIVSRLFKHAKENITQNEIKKAELVEASLALPHVCYDLTVHRVVMLPENKKIKVAFDNAFAGNVKLREVDTSGLFE